MFELFFKRLVYSFFDDDIDEPCLFLNSNTSVLNAAEKSLNREDSYRYDPIVVEFEKSKNHLGVECRRSYPN